MRIAILHFLDDDKSSHKTILQNLQRTANAKGHEVSIFSAKKDAYNLRLSIYDYICLIIPSSPVFGSKIPSRVSELLSSCGAISGKKAAALVLKSGFSSNKTARNLMRAMEREGLKLDYFDIVKNADHANYVGKKLG